MHTLLMADMAAAIRRDIEEDSRNAPVRAPATPLPAARKRSRLRHLILGEARVS